MHVTETDSFPQQQTVLLYDSDRLLTSRIKQALEKTSRFQLQICATLADVEAHRNDHDPIILSDTLYRDNHESFQHLTTTLPDHPLIMISRDLGSVDTALILQHPLWHLIADEKLDADSLQETLNIACLAQSDDVRYQSLIYRDPLTGVGNRRLFFQVLGQRVLEQRVFALITLSLDSLGNINQQHDYTSGDDLLCRLTSHLRCVFSDYDLYRLGNAEFAVLLEQDSSTMNSKSYPSELKALINELHAPQDETLINYLQCSIGVTYCPHHSTRSDTLLKMATLARHRAKQQPGTSLALYDAKEDQAEQVSRELEPELWRALRCEEFVLHYQPRVDLKTGHIAGAEALIRWQHPERGLISPNAFIQQCERNGIIIPLGYWIIQRAAMDMKLMQQQGLRGRIGVNLSFRQFHDRYLTHTINRLINQYNIDTSMLEFELTETSLYSDEAVLCESIEKMHDLGIHFSLDDFGTGYSSLSLLQKLPIQTLKIDRSFVSGLPEQNKDAEIVRTIIGLAHNLGKQVIAEGVETPAQRRFLRENDCDLMQGYLHSRPVPLDTLLEMLREDSTRCQDG